LRDNVSNANKNGLKMTPSTTELHTAFMRSTLVKQGYSFQSAMQVEALRICLVRLAAIAQRKLNDVKPTPPYWWAKD
jgi:hypothetical protein